MAILQLKPRAGGKELDRIATDYNKGTDWTAVEKQIDSGNADEIQVLCRYRQKAAEVGTSIWYTGVTMEDVGESPNAAEAKAKVEQAKKDQQVPGLAADLGERELLIAPAGRDVYVTPDGAGNKDGSDWANAMAAAGEGLQAAWNVAGPGNTVYVGSGEYRDSAIAVAAGGADHAHAITLQGVDTGGGLPKLVSGWDKADPAKGIDFVRISENVGYVAVAHVRLSRYRAAVVLGGLNVGVRIVDIDVNDTRDAFILNGGATADAPHIGTFDVVIQDCQVVGYSKRGVRIRDGVSGVRVVNCDVDAGGKPYATEPFHMGFSVQGSGTPKPAAPTACVTEFGTMDKDAGLKAPRAEWEGGDDAFNSNSYTDRGYHRP